jgi:hypothetical protein
MSADDHELNLPPARLRSRRPVEQPPEQQVAVDDAPRDYEVGYGRPPKHTRFKPGNNANPRGRPKGAKSLATLLAEELNQKVAVNIGGRSVKLAARQLAMKRLVQNLLKGDLRALQIALKLDELQGARERSGEADTQALDPAHEALMAAFLSRIDADEDVR